ncbi:hypothetical protein PPL_07464 [Heterostelium album PN500]|uniref:Uncharacterized protein n=1 Tax=Heterostelium pallidum (strain ATCC 26659 / Pp 5 / PN500) TaxID=670386 RepID=D3BG13_HETP5|nr:hypothetical protein PPL_07464 [Heterostelium album PN500]EFA79605.1 hypothetical protein PPL_07464 [Heterostelium album PN500]|eukprot:XP_020431726.1 hypothetical protein PPL_07464 [Heterostelium album PN500]
MVLLALIKTEAIVPVLVSHHYSYDSLSSRGRGVWSINTSTVTKLSSAYIL